jgi:hypothetical protein
MNELIENFVTNNIVVAKERIYAPAKLGGLGMKKLEPFLIAQKCAWIKRCFIKINDPWRWEFLRICAFSLNMVRLDYFDKARNPMLCQLVFLTVGYDGMKMVLYIYLLFFCLFLYLWLQVILNAVHFIFPLLVTHTKGGGWGAQRKAKKVGRV